LITANNVFTLKQIGLADNNVQAV